MGALLRLAHSLDDVRDDMDNYVRWVAKVHNKTDPNSLPSVLPEPKFTIPDGEPYVLRVHSLSQHTHTLETTKNTHIQVHRRMVSTSERWTSSQSQDFGGVRQRFDFGSLGFASRWTSHRVGYLGTRESRS